MTPRLRTALAATLFASLLALAAPQAQTADTLRATPVAAPESLVVKAPAVVLARVPFDVTVQGDGAISAADLAGVTVRVGRQAVPAEVRDGPTGATLVAEGIRVPARGPVTVEALRGGAAVASAASRSLPGWVSILPPLLAIALALAFRRVVPALFAGVLVGAVAVNGFTGGGLWSGLLDTMQVYILQALVDEGHAAIILFTLMIGGMVGIISKNGGTQGVVRRIAGFARTARRGQAATWGLGMLIFFDDYANSLILGNTMRPVTDRLRVSREKLAFLVDATSAPVASLALVTTWIGFEVGLIQESVAGIPELAGMSGYGIFLESVAFRFYPILMLGFVGLVAFWNRDFGPMHAAEVRARTTGAVFAPGAKVDTSEAESEAVTPHPGRPQRAINALLPVAVLVFGVVGGLFATGEGATVREIIGSADSYKSLMWASLLAVLTAAVLSVSQRILSLDETVEAWYAGLKQMLFAMIILLLAWALAATTEALQTGPFLASTLSEAIPAGAIPALVFVLAALTSFATGSSWGTMGILMPLVVPLAWGAMVASGQSADLHILYSAVSSVLAGAVWGDHCSPISDTTILSSMASGCDHIDHVRTQLPYALSVGAVAIFLGTLPAGFGMPWWLGLALGAAVLVALLRVVGKPVPSASAEPVEVAG